MHQSMTVLLENSTIGVLLATATVPIGNQTNATAAAPQESGNFLALFLVLIPLLTITGNILVVAAVFRERTLQSITNYFIVSLAIADFLVALVVMPFAVYVEVVRMEWGLGQMVCNLYIACDVCASTASILNLVAISVDRYIAITRPIYYSRHGNSKRRAYVTIIIVWTASASTALPILLGINQLNKQTICEFTEAFYIIVSSLISFYMPCIIMIILYSVILKRLHDRQKRQAKKKARKDTKVEKSKAGTSLTDHSSNLGQEMFGSHAAALLKSARLVREIGERLETKIEEETTINDTFDSYSTTSSSDEKFPKDESRARTHTTQLRKTPSPKRPRKESPRPNDLAQASPLPNIFSDSSANTGVFSNSTNVDDISTHNNCQTAPLSFRSFGEDLELIPFIDSPGVNSRPSSKRTKTAPVENLDKIEEFPKTPGSSFKNRKPMTLNSPFRGCSFKIRPSRDAPVLERERKTLHESLRNLKKQIWNSFSQAAGFRLKQLKPTAKHVAKRENRQIRKEQKATQTLAVVLVVFLCCWVPFFICHLTNAICIVKDDENQSCIPFLAFFLTTWLGYMNSFMNPIIYTIFNPEYRKAFRKIILFWQRAGR